MMSLLQVSALSSDGSSASNSSVVTATTFPYPSSLSLESANVTSLTVRWTQAGDDIQRYGRWHSALILLIRWYGMTRMKGERV